MTNHELARKMLADPEEPVEIWDPDAEEWLPVTGYTYGVGVVRLYSDSDDDDSQSVACTKQDDGGWIAFADREPPWDYEQNVQFEVSFVTPTGRVEIDTATHPNYSRACKFSHWRPLGPHPLLVHAI